MVFDEATLKRFWSKVDKRGPDDCWEWKLKHKGQRYGTFTCNKQRLYAHRASLFISQGGNIDDKSIMALHSCDNTWCCNPRHLRWGTCKDNVDDKFARHYEREVRRLKKIAEKWTRITPADLENINLWRSEGYGCKKIAKAYGVTSGHICELYKK